MFTSFVASTILLSDISMVVMTFHVEMMTWMATGDLYIPFGFVVDQVTVTMMMVVTFVSTVVHVYSIGYMDHDKAFQPILCLAFSFRFLDDGSCYE